MSRYSEISIDYDLDQGNFSQGEIEYIYRACCKHGLNVLDVGCGTGRISIPLGIYGANVIAIDNEIEMIKRGKQKLAEIQDNSRIHIQWVNMNAEYLGLAGKFNIVIFPNNVLFELNFAQMKRVLISLKSCIDKDGIVIIDVINVQEEWLKKLHGWRRTIGEYEVAEEKVKLIGSTNVDFDNQVIYTEVNYIHENKSARKMIKTGHIVQNYLYPSQILDLLQSCGYFLHRTLGGYDESDFNDRSKRYILEIS
jgi:ubiquinone/menaquinone biosynthesis C-methylase UbiE